MEFYDICIPVFALQDQFRGLTGWATPSADETTYTNHRELGPL